MSVIAFSQITLTSTVTNVSCFGGSNGSATITATGGTSPYTYTWIPTNTTTNIITGLAVGTYTVNVEDALANTNSLVVTITEPPMLVATTSATNANCGQNNGSLCAGVSGGVGVVSYLWSNGVITSCNSNVPAGAYTYTVMDANGCVVNSSGLVNDIAGPVVSIGSQTNVSCFGLCNGGAATSANGGITPYTYSWNNGMMTPSVTNLCPGSHTVSVTDNAGCIGTVIVNITQPPPLNATINKTNVYCFGTNTGALQAVVNGGVTPYTYLWPALSSTLASLTNVSAGMYSVTVTDFNGCTTSQFAIINQPTQLNINVSFTNATCGMCDGQVNALTGGGTAPYMYTWSPSVGSTSMLNGLCPNVYTLQITDAQGCLKTSTVAITSAGAGSLSGVSTTLTPINESCSNSSDGSIDLTLGGSNPGPFTYQWNNGSSGQDVFNIPAGTYNVTIFDAGMNCLTISSYVTSIGTNCGSISGHIFIDNNTDCINNSGDTDFQYAMVTVNPGNRYGYADALGNYTINNLMYGTYTMSLNGGNSLYVPTCTTSIISNINAGTPNSFNNNFSGGLNSTTQPDMRVYASSNNIAPGFSCSSYYYLNNMNNVNGTGLLKVTLPSSFIANIGNVTPSSYTLSGDTVIWSFTNMTYSGGNNSYSIEFIVPLSTPLGSTFVSCIYAQPNITDFDYNNNNYCYSRTVNGSFDPNDKTVSPVGVGPNGDIAATETDLTYLIRFQNTGNGPAVNIMVKDTLSPNVDINTFEMLGSSHNYNIDILDGNILRWKFNNIMLADSNSNESASHGYIQYRIKRTTNNTPGTQIKNTAYIYFDFNEPVVTNTAINTIETVTGIKSQSSTDNEWNVYPNPSTGVLYIVNHSSFKEASQMQVLNSIGQTLFEETITSNYKNIDLSKLTNGVYFVKIVSDKQSTVKRIVLSK